MNDADIVLLIFFGIVLAAITIKWVRNYIRDYKLVRDYFNRKSAAGEKSETPAHIETGKAPILKIGTVRNNVPYGWEFNSANHDLLLTVDKDGRIASIYGYTMDDLKRIYNGKWANDLCDAIEKGHERLKESDIEQG